MPNYPDISKDNCYLMSRYDGCLLDAKGLSTDIQVFSVLLLYSTKLYIFIFSQTDKFISLF